MTILALKRCYCTHYADKSLTRTCPWCKGSGVVVDPVPLTEYVSTDWQPFVHDFAEWGFRPVPTYQTDERAVIRIG